MIQGPRKRIQNTKLFELENENLQRRSSVNTGLAFDHKAFHAEHQRDWKQATPHRVGNSMCTAARGHSLAVHSYEQNDLEAI